MKDILKNTFWQLVVVYAILIALISFNLFQKYTLHFEIFALIVGLLGIIAIGKNSFPQEMNKKLHYLLLGIGIILIIGLRVLPYLSSGVPLGYDTGIYKYGIDSFSQKGFNVDTWVKSAFTPGFLYLMFALKNIFSSEFILIWLFILFNLILGLSVYSCTKEYFGKRAGIIAFLLFAVSVIQFKVFSFMYYKNILGLIFMLWALVFLKREKRLWFVVSAVFLGLMHRPTFFIFGLAYIGFVAYNWKAWKVNLRDGFLILILTGIGYIGFWGTSILPLISPVAKSFISPGSSSGTFVSFFTYQFSTLAYLPFAILGFGSLMIKKKFSIVLFWAAINAAIVYFQFFFFNRFIIHLDIALIILAGVGFSTLIQHKKRIGLIITILLIFSAGFVAFNESNNGGQRISEDGLEMIKSFENVEDNALVMVLTSEYSPWVLGYSNRKTIAPGLFEENKWNKEEWNRFWSSDSEEETKELMSVYPDVPIYLFAGTRSFNNPCFSVYSENNSWRIYKYDC